MEMLTTLFATFVAFVGGVIGITEAVNRLFKVQGQIPKLIVSWVLSIGLAILGLVLQLGFFADCGPIDNWVSWVKTVLIGLGCGLCANKIYDREEIWNIIQYIFSGFKSSYLVKK